MTANYFNNERVIVCDGGFATQLTRHVGECVDGDPLWSARFLATNPKDVIATHLDFLKAGAQAIITNTYQASVEGFQQYLNLSYAESIALIKTAVKLAHLARRQFLDEQKENDGYLTDGNIPLIVGSIGPYGAHLHNGSEYTGSYADFVTKDTLKKWHSIRIDAIIESGVDALAIETIPCQIEAEAIIELLCDKYPNTKFWVSFQCKDGTSIAHGEIFKEAILKLKQILEKRNALDNLLAFGVNCLHPKYVTSLFKSINGNLPKEQQLPLVVYPNSGEIYNVEIGWNGREDCIPLESYVPEWLNLNAKIIGGCCRTYAEDITRIKNAVQKHHCKTMNGDFKINRC